MKITSVKLCVIKKNGMITTWHDVGKPIEMIINEQFDNKNWKGGKFDWIYLEFDNYGQYLKVYVDHKKYNHLLK